MSFLCIEFHIWSSFLTDSWKFSLQYNYLLNLNYETWSHRFLENVLSGTIICAEVKPMDLATFGFLSYRTCMANHLSKFSIVKTYISGKTQPGDLFFITSCKSKIWNSSGKKVPLSICRSLFPSALNNSSYSSHIND